MPHEAPAARGTGEGVTIWVLEGKVPYPMYYRIKQHLLRQIEGGELLPGDRIPGEEQLAESFGVSRMTARQAVTELAYEGRLVRRQGSGTFVATPGIERRLAQLTTLTEVLNEQGTPPRSRLLSWREVPAAPQTARLFGLPPGEPVLRVARVRFVRETPIACQVLRLPGDLAARLRPGDLTADSSLYELLERRTGLTIRDAAQRVDAVAAPGVTARRLGVPAGSPLLFVRRTTYLDSGRVVEIARTLYRSDLYHFQVTLGRRQEKGTPERSSTSNGRV